MKTMLRATALAALLLLAGCATNPMAGLPANVVADLTEQYNTTMGYPAGTPVPGALTGPQYSSWQFAGPCGCGYCGGWGCGGWHGGHR
ncbi:MAG: hypothetical protein ACLQED_09135 [Desulfobaccales bacterium]